MKVKLYKKHEDRVGFVTINYDSYPSVDAYNQAIDEHYEMGYHDTMESAQQS